MTTTPACLPLFICVMLPPLHLNSLHSLPSFLHSQSSLQKLVLFKVLFLDNFAYVISFYIPSFIHSNNSKISIEQLLCARLCAKGCNTTEARHVRFLILLSKYKSEHKSVFFHRTYCKHNLMPIFIIRLASVSCVDCRLHAGKNFPPLFCF